MKVLTTIRGEQGLDPVELWAFGTSGERVLQCKLNGVASSDVLQSGVLPPPKVRQSAFSDQGQHLRRGIEKKNCMYTNAYPGDCDYVVEMRVERTHADIGFVWFGGKFELNSHANVDAAHVHGAVNASRVTPWGPAPIAPGVGAPTGSRAGKRPPRFRIADRGSGSEHSRLHDARIDELDIEGLLELAERVVGDAARMWSEASISDQTKLQRVFFPQGIDFDGVRFGTGVTCLAFRELPENSAAENGVASPAGFEPALPA